MVKCKSFRRGLFSIRGFRATFGMRVSHMAMLGCWGFQVRVLKLSLRGYIDLVLEKLKPRMAIIINWIVIGDLQTHILFFRGLYFSWIRWCSFVICWWYSALFLMWMNSFTCTSDSYFLRPHNFFILCTWRLYGNLSFSAFRRNFNGCCCIFLWFATIFTGRRDLFLFYYTRRRG